MTLYFLVVLGASVDVEQFFSIGFNTLMMLKIGFKYTVWVPFGADTCLVL